MDAARDYRPCVDFATCTHYRVLVPSVPPECDVLVQDYFWLYYNPSSDNDAYRVR
ncbi:hypothetical protein DFJ75_0990 [Williamsia muralis]|uniref:Uncharacterized protein n=1 Tax=Williamsia marianensis TaxID=85044 RepID=A0A495K177_WILMA|nr:hypothetical protein DFJ75_0990 [Williamsia muralis]